LRIYDCFIFSNEWDLLRLRLDELDPVVDEFVIVQATTTFQGSAKEVVRLKNDSRFSQFSHKIRDIIVDDLPKESSPWFSEYLQRNAARRVADEANSEDIILLSDVDEIPSRGAVEDAKTVRSGQVYGFEMRMFYYGLNWQFPTKWWSVRAFRAESLKYLSPQELRTCPPDTIIPNGGWHFSYFYKQDELIERIKAKALAFSHTEFTTPEYLRTSYLQFCIRGGLSWCTVPKSLIKFRYSDVDETYPEMVKDDAASWRSYRIAMEDRDRRSEALAWLLHSAVQAGRSLPPRLRSVVKTEVSRFTASASPSRATLKQGVTSGHGRD